ncbi:hypothetical protein [Salipaludibacillus sp. CF4.18]|uniref:hypothetical protein n=1 Tax=Salipaludibacillus sp. CF4.18 TaxID=3373081 RepID=UPI003EE52DC4
MKRVYKGLFAQLQQERKQTEAWSRYMIERLKLAERERDEMKVIYGDQVQLSIKQFNEIQRLKARE